MASFLHIQISGMTISGRRVPDVNYTRTEHADGMVTETGTPPAGVTATTPAVDVIGMAIPPAAAGRPAHPNAAVVGSPAQPRPNRTKKGRK